MRYGSPADIHVWWTVGTRDVDLGVLSEAETDRVQRLRRCEDRETQAASFALRRAVLGPLTGHAPEALAFARRCELCGATDHGRPLLEPGYGRDDVGFSVSHRDGIAVVAVAFAQDVGVDVETEADAKCWTGVLPLLSHARDDRLSPRELWTAKEAALKALGMGLAIPPCGIRITCGRAIVPMHGRRRALTITWSNPTHRHVVAVASQQPARIWTRRWPGHFWRSR